MHGLPAGRDTGGSAVVTTREPGANRAEFASCGLAAETAHVASNAAHPGSQRRTTAFFMFATFTIPEPDDSAWACPPRARPLLRTYPNGFSMDGLCGVNQRAPSAPTCMSSSSRTPNSPGM
ncbi:hypothetical protein GCM10028797_13870 [Dyella agri]